MVVLEKINLQSGNLKKNAKQEEVAKRHIKRKRPTKRHLKKAVKKSQEPTIVAKGSWQKTKQKAKKILPVLQKKILMVPSNIVKQNQKEMPKSSKKVYDAFKFLSGAAHKTGIKPSGFSKWLIFVCKLLQIIVRVELPASSRLVAG